MADAIIIKIDLEAVRQNLSTGEARDVPADEVAAFLREVGIIDNGDGSQTCEEISLRALKRDEWTA